MLYHGLSLLMLIWPFAFGALCLLAACFPQTVLSKAGVLRLNFFDFFSFEHGIEKGALRVIFIVLSFILFLVPAFRDYSRFFPESLNVAVFFDDHGIENLLQALSEKDAKKLSVAPDWRSRKKAYIEKMNQELDSEGVPFRFRDAPGQTSAVGQVKIKIRMVEGWGAQLYQIAEARGSLVHTSEMPGTEQYQIVSEFELLHTESTMIKGTIRDVYLARGLMLLPEFKQLFRVAPTKEVYHNSMIAATRADIFPYVNISETLYLVRQGDGYNVPIAYGFYTIP